MSAEEFRRVFEQPSREGSVVERMPVSRFGTGNRRYYKKDDEEGKRKGKGMHSRFGYED